VRTDLLSQKLISRSDSFVFWFDSVYASLLVLSLILVSLFLKRYRDVVVFIFRCSDLLQAEDQHSAWDNFCEVVLLALANESWATGSFTGSIFR
jgi:hypothetical protein